MTFRSRRHCCFLLLAALALGLACRLTVIPLPALATEAAQVNDLLSGKVLWVYDGDTLEVSGVGKVRMIGIDAPEREPSPRDDFFLRRGIAPGTLRRIHRQGLDFLIGTVKGEMVYLEGEKPKRDRHGRLLAYVFLSDGQCLNKTMLDKGYAVVYRRFDFSRKPDFLKAEESARRQKQGLWQ
ncbi:MAG: thermonuclease family protein [Syntrophotaleaceae bacterium]